MRTKFQNIDAIFFDAVGTLFEVRGSVGKIYSERAREHGISADAELLDRRFREAFARKSCEPLPPPGCGNTAKLEKMWWMEVVAHVFAGQVPQELFSGLFEDVFAFFSTGKAWLLLPDACRALRELRRMGFRLGIISNYDSRLVDLLADLGIHRHFEQVILSWHTGAAKPDPAIFQYAAAAMRLEAARCLHIGDSPAEDIVGAQRAGMPAVLLDRFNRYSGWTEGMRARSLLEITWLFG